MPTPNPDYNPRTIEFQTAYSQRLNRLTELKRVKFSNRGLNPEQQTEQAILQARKDAEREQFEKTFYTMHPTIQDYARWRGSTCITREDFPVKVEELDIEQLTTREAADRLFRVFQETAETYERYKNNQKQLGQPTGVTAFSTGHKIEKLNFQFNFNSPIGPSTTKSPVVVDQHDGRVHICLTHIQQNGVSVINGIEEIATNMLMAQKSIDDQDGRPGTLAKDFVFYAYLPPQVTQEAFMRVDMPFVEGRYRNPNFVHFDCVPETIRAIADDLMEGQLAVLKSLRCLDGPQ